MWLVCSLKNLKLMLLHHVQNITSILRPQVNIVGDIGKTIFGDIAIDDIDFKETANCRLGAESVGMCEQSFPSLFKLRT